MAIEVPNLIDNAAVGTFPSIQALKEPIVWRHAQRERMEAAIIAGQWRPLFDENDVLIV